jgi:GntR family transcriptional regulator
MNEIIHKIEKFLKKILTQVGIPRILCILAIHTKMKDKMFIVVSPLNPDPMYKQVADHIKDAIASGILKPEEKLPSIREMTRELGISGITIKRAYTDLEHKGYIFTRSGLGSFVADVNKEKIKKEKMAEIRQKLIKIIKSGEKFGISSDDIIEAIRKKGVEK